ncbi:insulinase family protein [Thalassotalea sp. PP2-459]|uniref:insulinase family protein n=1 Tax=Thalassotalea sp. PP2-459 TaxID=1742724 RepID=UPI0009450943|nr:insulinase family protein [Thalassotalea sp. PP2-459]OKY24616.1 peptidase M16 [Thalassotalea sp. PP2-459]
MKQSPNDHKTYSAITLENGLRVLLVHHKESKKAAAALAVNVGHFSDPDDRQGMAHFLEHMLFLGTEKYPDGSEYQKFISQYGGSNNAWTATEHTCFFFDIHHTHFEQALDRFSQFFIAPLLSEEFVNKERKNIDAEFKLKLKDDIRRLYDVHKATINPEHPFSKFSVGNTETLSDKENRSLRDEVDTFFQQYYNAKAMTLVLEGPQTIEELRSFATQYFTGISANTLPPSLPDVSLYLPAHQGIKIQVQPVKNERQLIISFALPSIDQYYRHKPESLLAYLLGHEGENSILSYLKNKHWAIGLTAGSGINGYNFKDFNISIRLTDIGTQHINDIIDAVFFYISLIKEAPLADFYYQEKKAIAELSFHYHEKTKPIDSVSQLVINMQHYPEEDYIYGDYMMEGIDNNSIEYLLEKLSPNNMRVIVIDPKVQGNQVTNWYQVPYNVEPIAQSELDHWQHINKELPLALPSVNNYIVGNPVVYENQQDKFSQPQRITQQDGLTLWYKQDQTFKVPKGYIYIGIDAPATLENAQTIAMTRLYVELYTESVIEQHYDAELAGIQYHLYAHQGGLTLQLSGLSEKQEVLLAQLLNELQSFQYQENKFNLIKKQLINHWNNAENSKSISQLFSALSATMQPKNPDAKSLTSALEQTTFARFTQFCQSIFTRVNIEVLIHGNWQREHATSIEYIILQAFKNQLSSDAKQEVPVLDIQQQGSLYYPLALPKHDHAAVIYYPMVDRATTTVALTMIISQILSPQFFHQMRTEKQYGYLVGVGYVPINRYPGIAFYIQSPNHNADSLLSAMDDFINNSGDLIDQMSEDDWHHLQKGLASQLQEKDTSLRIKSQRFWNAICNQEFDFNQKQTLIDTLLRINKDDIKQFLLNNIVVSKQPKDRLCLASLAQTSTEQLTELKNKLTKLSIKH